MTTITRHTFVNSSFIGNIVRLFEYNGFKIYAVGGCVRDAILGRIPHDYDFTTNATPDEMKSLVDSLAGVIEVIPTGEKHGVMTFYGSGYKDHPSVEITTFRVDDDYEDHRHPNKVKFTHDILEDLKRRDFTINSFAYDLVNDKLVCLDDSFYNDFKVGVIRAVGNPTERFTEDALRILRGIRFAAQLDFVISEETYKAMDSCFDLLKNISKERIRDELTKILLSDHPEYLTILLELDNKHCHVLFGSDLFSKMLKTNQTDSMYHYTDVWHHTIDVIKSVKKNFICRWEALFHDCGKPDTTSYDQFGFLHFYGHAEKSAELSEPVMDLLKFSNDQKEVILNIVKYHESRPVAMPSFKRLVRKVGENNIDDLLSLMKADAMSHSCLSDFSLTEIEHVYDLYVELLTKPEPLDEKQLVIDGNDLKTLGYVGKEIGVEKKRLLEYIINNPDENIKEKLLAIAQDDLLTQGKVI